MNVKKSSIFARYSFEHVTSKVRNILQASTKKGKEVPRLRKFFDMIREQH